MKYLFAVILFLIVGSSNIFAFSDPRLVPNNIVGINSLSPENDIEDIHKLVNSNGDWGWVVVVIGKNERNKDRWQSLFNKFTQMHIIPIVRISTQFNEAGYWEKPEEADASSWADFLNQLYWPTKNRYVQVYNEVNGAGEWGGKVDAAEYASELFKTASALKSRNQDFFILNAPLDLSLPTTSSSVDAEDFLVSMNNSNPGIFSSIDGLASHSYPNPEFSAVPVDSGRTSLTGYKWELNVLKSITGEDIDLPVFITETGWKRGNGSNLSLTEETIADYYQSTFKNIWNDKNIVVVAPFLLNYPEELFAQFSFIDNSSDKKYFKYFDTVRDLPKVVGMPVREDILFFIDNEISEDIVKGRDTEISIKLKNVGNYIWNTEDNFKVSTYSNNIKIKNINWSSKLIYPGEEFMVTFTINSPEEGINFLKLSFFNDNQLLGARDLRFNSSKFFMYLILNIGSKIN